MNQRRSDIWDTENQHLQTITCQSVVSISSNAEQTYTVSRNSKSVQSLQQIVKFPPHKNIARQLTTLPIFNIISAIISDTRHGFWVFSPTESHNRAQHTNTKDRTRVQYYKQHSNHQVHKHLLGKHVYPYDSYQTMTTVYKQWRPSSGQSSHVPEIDWMYCNVKMPSQITFFQLWSTSLLINVLLTSALPHMAGTNYF